MLKQSLGQFNIDLKDLNRIKKQKNIYEIRKKQLKKNLKKRKQKIKRSN